MLQHILVLIICILLLYIAYDKILKDFILTSTYRGSNIEGEWEVYYNNLEKHSAVISFTQHGAKVKGKSIVQENTKGQKVDRQYFYNGKQLQNSLILHFQDSKNATAFGGVMVFYISDSDGLSMTGTTLYYKPELNKNKIVHALLIKKGANKSNIMESLSSQSNLSMQYIPKTIYKNLVEEGKYSEVIEKLKLHFTHEEKISNLLINLKIRVDNLFVAKASPNTNRAENQREEIRISQALLLIVDKM